MNYRTLDRIHTTLRTVEYLAYMAIILMILGAGGWVLFNPGRTPM